MDEGRAGKNNFLPGSTTWRQKKFPADQRSIFVLNMHVHKRMYSVVPDHGFNNVNHTLLRP